MNDCSVASSVLTRSKSKPYGNEALALAGRGRPRSVSSTETGMEAMPAALQASGPLVLEQQLD